MSQLPSLSVTYSTTVTPDQIDELGHMNVRWYGHSARAATRALTERLGLAEPSIVSAYTRHHHEQLVGSALEVRSAVMDRGPGLWLYHELRNQADNDLAATFVYEIDHRRIEANSIELPDYGRPRTLDLNVDRSAAFPPLDELRARGLAARLERPVTEQDAHPNDLFWGGERPGGESSWIHETADGDRVASATMESRIWLPHYPALGTRIQSFMANLHVGDKISHEIGWVFDLDAGTPLAVYEGVDLAFSINQRKSVVKPPEVKQRELQFLHPDLA
jgi:acyl-CoA thioester hydrolase